MKINEVDHDFHTHDDYLKHISTSINCATDLQLYQIEMAIANEYMGLIGVKILSQSLQKEYGHKKYLLRGYYVGEKFFELAIGKVV
jgi:hypothetical protein